MTFSPAMREAKNYMRWVLSPFLPYIGKSVLEIGIGHGGYRDYLPADAAYTGIDIDRQLVEAAQRERSGDYICADARDTSLRAALPKRPIDTILCLNVLEHITEDKLVIQNLLSLLEPQGHLLVFVPAFPALYSSLDRHAGHVRRYTLDDLKALVAKDQGTIVKAHYFNALGGMGWWVNKWFSHASLDTQAVNGQLSFFDRYLVPFANALDSVCMNSFGQSVVLVIRKS